MKRREFIAGLGAAAWPLAVARAQRSDRMRRIGALMTLAADDPESLAGVTAFAQGLQERGWTVGRDVRIDYRWGGSNTESLRTSAAELLALGPDVLLGTSGSIARALQQATRTVPIVFSGAIDPVGSGLVASLARPGGNTTGFSSIEYGLSAKWLELLKQIAPRVTRTAVVRDPTAAAGGAQLGAIQAVAPSLGVTVSPVDAREAGEIERTVTAFARGTNGGLIVTASIAARIHRKLIVTLAAHHQLPAVYSNRTYVEDGGLISYGNVLDDNFRRAAGYVDRILKGEKPADLPVPAPTRYETVINLKTAKALGLEIPQTLLATADEVIQ